MASTIRIDCPTCGTTEVPVAAARLLLELHPDTLGSNVVEYTCPGCNRLGHHPVDERGTRLLTAAGITVLYPDALSSRRDRGDAGTGEAARMPSSGQHPRRSPPDC